MERQAGLFQGRSGGPRGGGGPASICIFFEVWRQLIDPIDPKWLGSKSYTMRSSIHAPGGTVPVDCASLIGGGHGLLRLGSIGVST